MAWLGDRPFCLFDSPSGEGLHVLPLFAAWDILKTRYLLGAFFFPPVVGGGAVGVCPFHSFLRSSGMHRWMSMDIRFARMEI